MTSSTCDGGTRIIGVTQGEFSRDRRETIDGEDRRWQVPMLVRTIGGKDQRVVVRDGQARIHTDNCGAAILNGGQLGYFRTLYTPEALGALRSNFAGLEPIDQLRSEEHTSELQSLMRISYAVFCLKKKTKKISNTQQQQ